MHLVLSRVVPEDFDALVPLQFKSFADVDLNNAWFGPDSPAGHAYAKRTELHAFLHDPADVWMKVTDEDVDVEYDVLDNETGEPTGQKRKSKRIVAGSNWKVWPTLNQEEHEKRNGGTQAKGKGTTGSTNFDTTNPETTVSATANSTEDYSHITWHTGHAQKRDTAKILADFLRRRRIQTAEAHVLCFLMFVDPEYQRKGAGSMCMKWGTELGDQLMLPCWIEASPVGEPLYRKFGYVEAGEDEYGLGKGRVRMQTESFLSEYLHMKRPTKVERLVGRELRRE